MGRSTGEESIMERLEGLELDIQIEELEAKIAPGGGETVLPLPKGHSTHH
jgi:hypothetical protein